MQHAFDEKRFVNDWSGRVMKDFVTFLLNVPCPTVELAKDFYYSSVHDYGSKGRSPSFFRNHLKKLQKIGFVTIDDASVIRLVEGWKPRNQK